MPTASPLLSALQWGLTAPGDYLRGGLTGQLGSRVDPSGFNQQMGIPQNAATDFLTGALVDPMTIAGLGLATRTGRQAMRSLARPRTWGRLAKSETGSLGRRGSKSIEGEFWLDDSGLPTFADGDVSDFTHEAVATMHAQREIIGKHPSLWHLAEDEFPDWEEYVRQVFQQHGVPEDLASGRVYIQGNWKGSENRLAHEARTSFEKMLQAEDIPEDLWQVAAGVGDLDPRDYAARHWGWTRMAGNSLDTYGLDKTKLQRLARGVSDASSYMVEDVEREVFDLYDHKTRKFYEEVPFHVLDDGDMKALRDYLSG